MATQREVFLKPIVEGRWTGTMCLTEPHCGSDLGLLKSKAEPQSDGSYKVTAQFLAYLVEKYDKEIVRKLNKAMREGEYKDEIWQSLTKKSLKGLGEEWKESLKPKSSTETGALDR